MTGGAPARQLGLFEDARADPANRADSSSTFADNLSLPIHRWFRYSAGFSAVWASSLLRRERALGRRTFLDPFAGSGTAVIEAEATGLRSIGVEAHPFVARVARAKLLWRSSTAHFQELGDRVLVEARRHTIEPHNPPDLLERCFPRETLRRLFSLLGALAQLGDTAPASELTWLALVGIIRECSPVGTAPWQYILPNRLKNRSADPFEAFRRNVALFAGDMALCQRRFGLLNPTAEIRQEDARTCASVGSQWADLIVTSPPYANNYDYADATRLEMTFLGEISSWGDLQNVVRRYLVRSCSQHVAPIVAETETLLAASALEPIRGEIRKVCGRLEEERQLHGGKKPYHTMVAAYFSDMANVWIALRRVASPGALVCFVVGDSAPYGIHVPVEQWLGRLAVAAGFSSFSFEKTRDRNVKWRNRKHRVPLQEGRLWLEG